MDSIDGGSYDPDGPGDIVELCITAVDGMPVGCVPEYEICGVDTYTVTLRATDKCGSTSSCDATVIVRDITPPDISVVLNRYVLWPPNHKMADIVATIEVEDNCDPDPQVVLASIVSDESPDSLGDGSTDPDVDADIGTDDRDFSLRAERAGGGDGRTYAITYTATDFSDNSASVTVYVDVWERRGKIITLEWATVKPDSTVEYIYDIRKFKAISTEERDKLSAVDLLINAFKDHEKMLNELFNKLIRQIEALDEKLKLEKE